MVGAGDIPVSAGHARWPFDLIWRMKPRHASWIDAEAYHAFDFGFNARYKVQYPAAYWVDRSGNDSGFTEPWWQVQQVEEWTTVNTGQ